MCKRYSLRCDAFRHHATRSEVCVPTQLMHADSKAKTLGAGCKPSPMKAMYALKALSTLHILHASQNTVTQPVVQAYEAGASIVFSKNYYVR